MVVISGPEATAGSTPNFLNRMGIMVPEREDASIASTIAIPRQPETEKAKMAAFPLIIR